MNLAALVAMLVATAPASPATSDQPFAPAAGQTPAQYYQAAEDRFTALGRWDGDWTGKAHGLISADLHADLKLSAAVTAIHVLGTFNGQQGNAILRATPSGLTLNTAKLTSQPAPKALADSVTFLLFRLGFMHDASSLITGDLPESSPRTAVIAHDFTWAKAPDAGTVGISYIIDWTPQKKAAEETLFISTVTGLPVSRSAVVHFPKGDFFVDERYVWRDAASTTSGG